MIMTIIQIAVFLIGLYFIVRHHLLRKYICLLMAIGTGYIYFLMYGFPSYGKLISAHHLLQHLKEELKGLINLGGLLVGFACLSYQFEKSEMSKLFSSIILKRFSDRTAESLLFAMIWLLSGFIDNIAAALIGIGIMVIVHGSFRLRNAIGVTLIANAGGAYSVMGDTTTTLLWISGVSQRELLPAFLPSFTVLIATIFCSIWLTTRHKHPIRHYEETKVIWWRFFMVIICIGLAFLCNFKWGLPCLGILPLVILTCIEWKMHPLRDGFSAVCFLLPLVIAAGFINLGLVIPHDILRSTGMIISTAWLSAIVDNIPITKLLYEADVGQWGMLAFCVGVGGSMTYFGSTTSIAILECYPNDVKEILQRYKFKNLFLYWILAGWYVCPVIILGILVGVLVG